MQDETTQSIYGLLSDRARSEPDEIAVIFEGEELRYADLHRQVTAFAQGLRRLDIGPGSTIAVLCTNRPEWLIGALGALAAGASVAAFNTWSKRWDLDHMLEHSRCRAVIALKAFRTLEYTSLLREMCPELWGADASARSRRYPELREIVFIGGDGEGTRSFDDVMAEGSGETDALDVDNAAAGELVLYTSGSTARPKAVRLRQDVALEHARDVGARMGVHRADRIWLPVPLFWSYGSANALMVALTHTSALVLQEAFDPKEALDIIERHQCTVLYTLANISGALLSHPDFSAGRVASLQRGMTIGSPRDVRQAAEGLEVPGLCNAYGSTEIYGGACVTPWDWPLDRKCETQGPPLPRIHLRIRDRETGAPMPQGETGEITVSGQVTEGYLRQPEATAAAFNEHGEYKTGDLGYLDEDGSLHFVGRATEMIKSGGINIAPLEIEDFLLSHEDVQEAAVVAANDPEKDEVPVAFVRISSGSALDARTLKDHCREYIASFKVPELIVVSDAELTKTDTGKLARMKLREQAQALWDDERARRAAQHGAG